MRKPGVVPTAAAWLLMLALAGGTAFSLWVGGELVAARPAVIGASPADLHAEDIVIGSGDRTIRGWWMPGDSGKASVLLLHGIRANRLAMASRARMLARHGYSVLLIDLPAHGESAGRAITFGVNESHGVQSARRWIGSRRPGKPVAAIGVSLGGAAVLLGPSPTGFDAVVLEAVYTDAHRALQNRMRMRVGPAAPMLGKLLEWQLEPRLRISLDQLRPIDRIDAVGAPVMVIAGGRDRHTTPAESAELFARARSPKEYWLLPQAAHQDFERLAPLDYEREVISFLDRALPPPALTD